MKETKAPRILAVDGKTELEVHDAESHPHYLDEKDRKETIEGITRGLESMKQWRGKPATEFFREFFVEKGIPERE